MNRSLLPILFVAVSCASAATVQNHLFSRVLPPANTNCAVPPAADYYQNSDDNLIYWATLANVSAGDVLGLRWSSSAGQLDSSVNFAPIASPGTYCFYEQMPLKVNPVQAVSGTWTFQVLVNGAVVLNDTALVLGPNMPSISRGGVKNSAAGTVPGGIVAPGTLVSIYGTNLSSGTAVAPGEPLPTSLGGVSVTMNGTPVGVYQVSPGEVDVQAPWSIPSDTVFVQVNNNGVLTNVERARVGAASPGAFYDSTSTQSPAFVYRFGADGSDGGFVSPSNPLQRGDTAVFFGTGFGPVSDPPPNFGSGNADSTVLLPIGVSFGGARALQTLGVLSDAADAADVGVNFIYAIVPAEAPNGPAVPVSINVAGMEANPVTVPIDGTPPAIGGLTLQSISHYPAGVDSGSTYNPGATMSLAAGGLLTNVKTYVHVDDGRGYKFTIPAVEVYTDHVVGIVPPYVDENAHQVTSGTVNCTLIQLVGGQVVTSNALGLQIGNLPRGPGATGHITSSYLATLAQGPRNMDSLYTYKQRMNGGSAFTAASSHRDMQLLTGGLRPLVGGADEVANGAASTVDLGTINGQDVTLDNNSLILFDSMITAVLKENRKAVTLLPAVTSLRDRSSPARTESRAAEPQASVFGLLGTYFGKVVSCNMPWNKVEDEVSGQTSNCPTPAQAVDNVLVASAESLVEAVNGVAQDAKRFKAVMGVAAVVLMGEAEAPVLVAKLATDTSVAQAVGGFAASWIAGKAGSSAQQQEAMKAGLEAAADGLKDFAGDKIDSGVAAGLKPVDEELEQGYKAAQTGFDADEQLGIDPRPSMLATFNTLRAEVRSFVFDLLGPHDDTNADGSNSEDDSIPNTPAFETTGKVQSTSGGPLADVTVQLSTGDDSGVPVAVSATRTDGSYDLLIPQGANVPAAAQLEVVTMDESGDQATFTGSPVALQGGSQTLNTVSISYDSDDDGDDDSDGTNAVHRVRVPLAHPQEAHRVAPVRTFRPPSRVAAQSFSLAHRGR